MRIITVCACGMLLLTSAARAEAQLKFSGTCVAQKADPQYTAQVGDRAGHILMLAKQKCTWNKAELAGLELKDEDDTVTSDMMGKTSHDHGYGVGTAANGDKYFVRFDGTTTFTNNVPTALQCTWSFTGGTGKLKGITGKGTCSGPINPDGTANVNVEGTYQIAATPKTE